MGSYSRKRYATESASFPKSANSAPGSYSYATFADLPASGSTPGNTAFVVATNRLYIWSGVGWYLIATVTNASPTAITGVDGSYALANDGTATTITAVSTDPEGFSLTWSYAVSSGSLGSTATVSQADNVFTITPSTNSAHEGTFSLTFSVTDGINGVVSAVSAFTLSFIITNSRYTSLSLKATATGSNQTFDDASASNHTITVAGNSTTSTFSPHRHGGYSLKFENSVADDNNIKFNNVSGAVAASGEFCVETWVKFTVYSPATGSANARIFVSNGTGGNAANNLQILPEYSGSYAGEVGIYSNTWIYQPSNTSAIINDGQWHHLAVTRDSSNNLRWFVDGILITTVTNTTTFQFEETRLGKRDGGTGTSCFTGEMRDTRVVIGSSVYESAFTPPTEPLTAITNTYLLVGDLPYIKDESTNNFSINAGTYSNGSNVLLPKKSPISLFDNGAYTEANHGASAYFDGSGDYLTFPHSTSTAEWWNDDFTIEAWVYYTSFTESSEGRPHVLKHGVVGSTTDYWSFGAISNGTLLFYYWNGSAIATCVSTSTLSLNTWHHITMCHDDSDNEINLYLDGVNVKTHTVSGTPQSSASSTMIIGSNTSSYFTGYMSNLRVIKGTEVYTSNFTPPTAPLTNSPTYPAMAIGVANSGASSYTLSGDVTGSNATVNMAIGQTVNFTVNASGHPFHIRVSDGGANVSTPAATGQGATSGVVSWTPNTAGTYYYQCSVHAGMIGTINVTAGVKFLLNPEPSILDLSQSSEITCFGDASTSTTQVKFAGTKSIYLDGTGDYVQISNVKDSWISGYTRDYTIEFWWYPTNVSVGNYQEILTVGTGFQLYIFNGGGLSLAISDDNTTPYFWSPTEFHTMANNTWQHIAFVRNGNVYTIYVDGVSKTTTTTTNLINTGTDPLQLGIYGGSLYPTVGYFQDLRITKGLAKYTSNFTPPTAELEG